MRLIVIRPHPSLPPGYIGKLEGLWLDLDSMGVRQDYLPEMLAGWRAHATGEYEVRDYDGARAEIYEVR